MWLVLGAVAAVTSLPLGDGHVSYSTPKQGWIYLCAGGPAGGGGAVGGSTPWIHGSTFDPSAKPVVAGSVTWPNARISFTKVNGHVHVVGNGLPKSTPTGVFPIQPGTTAYQYDRNPNTIVAQTINWTLPIPKPASRPSCLTGGPIGIAVNGVPIFDALDALNRDGVAHEIQDSCGGHPQQQGMYHYHEITSCLPKTGLVGYALDGYPIYAGGGYTDAQLDACHGITVKGQYRYEATAAYPYTLGCFHGSPLKLPPPR
jgi:hypothetical protein